jgi:hypothetical protein
MALPQYTLNPLWRSTSRRPIDHVFNNANSDFAYSFEHFEDFMAKQLFKITRIGWWAYHEGVIAVKVRHRRIGGQNPPEADG